MGKGLQFIIHLLPAANTFSKIQPLKVSMDLNHRTAVPILASSRPSAEIKSWWALRYVWYNRLASSSWACFITVNITISFNLNLKFQTHSSRPRTVWRWVKVRFHWRCRGGRSSSAGLRTLGSLVARLMRTDTLTWIRRFKQRRINDWVTFSEWKSLLLGWVESLPQDSLRANYARLVDERCDEVLT